MKDELILNNRTNKSYQQGIQAVVDQDFEKGIDLLEFSYETTPNINELEVLPMLMIAYFSIGRFDEAYALVDYLDKKENLAPDLLMLMRQIKMHRAANDVMAKAKETKEVLKETKDAVDRIVEDIKKETGGDINVDLIDTRIFNIKELLKMYPNSELLQAFADRNINNPNITATAILDFLPIARKSIDTLIDFNFTQVDKETAKKLSQAILPFVKHPELVILTTNVDYELIEENHSFDYFPFICNYLFTKFVKAVFPFEQNQDFLMNYRFIPFTINEYHEIFVHEYNVVVNKLRLVYGDEYLKAHSFLLDLLLDMLLIEIMHEDSDSNEVVTMIVAVLNCLGISNVTAAEMDQLFNDSIDAKQDDIVQQLALLVDQIFSDLERNKDGDI